MPSAHTAKQRRPRKHFAFSTLSSALVIVAAVSALALEHNWGKRAIPAIEWICGAAASLLVMSLIVDSRRP